LADFDVDDPLPPHPKYIASHKHQKLDKITLRIKRKRSSLKDSNNNNPGYPFDLSANPKKVNFTKIK
jgi:hypothetical protein